MTAVEASVVICTRNRSEQVRRLLLDLAAQRAEVDWEVLVVANNCSDETERVVPALAAEMPVPLRLEVEGRHGLAAARNRALETAAGGLLLFLDDDTTCRPGWLAAHLAAFADPRVVGTGGRIVPVLPREAPAWFVEDMTERLGGPTARYDIGDALLDLGGGSPHPLPFGANMGIRRSALAAVGRFRTDLGWGRSMIVGEDTELMSRLAARGGRLVYVPDAVVDHHIGIERCNREYFTRWYRGFGRAAIRYDPPASRLERLALAASAVRLWTRNWPRTVPDRLRRDGRKYARSLRNSATALGRLQELMTRGGGVEPGQGQAGVPSGRTRTTGSADERSAGDSA